MEYNMIALKAKLTDDYAIHLPIFVCNPLGADFDGDAVVVHAIPEEYAEETMKVMSPRYVTKYKKNLQNITEINMESLNGLSVATKIEYDDPSELKDPHLFYDNYVDLLKDVEVNHKISPNRIILFSGKVGELEYNNQVTTLARLRLSKEIGADIDTIPGVISEPLAQINGGGADNLISYLQQFPDYTERLSRIQKYALMSVTRKGVLTFDFDTLYANTDTNTYKEIKSILNNPKYSDKQKILLVNEAYKKYTNEVKGSIREDVKVGIKDANRVKIDSILAMVTPSFTISGVNEVPMITNASLIGGMSNKDYINHAIENRAIQSIKNSSTPSSGYLSRQLRFLMSDYNYSTQEDDKDNKCIMIPRYRAEGRTAPDGSTYPKFSGTASESDLVPVRSIVTKSKNPTVVTPDLISTLYHYDMKDKDPIGISFSSSLTQAITQKSLSLKHGGHERMLDESGYMRSPCDGCTMEISGPWIILHTKDGDKKYPKPDDFVINDKASYKEGEVIGTAYHTESPISSLNSVIKLIRARGSDGSRYYEKDNVIVTDCYAYEEGEIKYVYDEDEHTFSVKIGNIYYDYSPESMYYFPDGATVGKYQRFCNGVANMRKVTNDLNDPAKIYRIFRSQFYYSTSKDYREEGIVSGSDNREEIVELTYVSLVHTTIMTDGSYDIEYKGVHSGIMDNDSFYTLLSYGYAGKVINRALRGDLDIKEDSSTRTILGLLLNNKLDSTEEK